MTSVLHFGVLLLLSLIHYNQGQNIRFLGEVEGLTNPAFSMLYEHPGDPADATERYR
jgi:hypothetical protein